MTTTPNDDSRHLRFTRSGQAVHFVLIGLVFLCASGALFVLSLQLVSVEAWVPPVNSPLWCLLPLPFAAGAFYTAFFLARHACLVFGPIGLEIYPFWSPGKKMDLITWGEMENIEVNGERTLLTITRTKESGGGGCYFSLSPIARRRRELLVRAVAGVRETHLPAS